MIHSSIAGRQFGCKSPALLFLGFVAFASYTCLLPTASLANDQSVEVEVTLHLPRSQTLARALEISRALEDTGTVASIKYAVTECEHEKAEIISKPETPESTICTIIDALSRIMFENIEVRSADADDPDPVTPDERF